MISSERMCIVQINASYGIGSTGRIVESLDRALECENHYSYCVYSRNGNSIPKCGYRMGNYVERKMHGLLTRIIGMQAYGSRVSTRRLLTVLKELNPDVVHLHNLHANYICYNMLLDFLSEYNIPTVLTLHDTWFFTGKCTHFMNVNCDRWLSNCGSCPRNKDEVVSILFDNTNRAFIDKKKRYENIKKLYVVGCSDWISYQANASPMYKNAVIKTIQNGIDTDVFYYRNHKDEKSLNCLSNRFVVLGIADKWLRKGNGELIDFVLNISPDITIIIIGCSEKEKESLERRYSKDRLVAFDYINGSSEMADKYNVADVFIDPTVEDTYPTVIMESCCCGTPVIAYNTGGCGEMISEGVNGYIVEQNDREKLERAIRDIINGKISREICAEYGREHFSQCAVIEKYIGLYKEIKGR